MLKSEEEKVLLLSASIFSLKDAISVFFFFLLVIDSVLDLLYA